MDAILSALGEEHAELDTLLQPLDDAGWSSPTRCDGWTVADVVLHLAQTDQLALASARGQFADGLAVLASNRLPGSAAASPSASAAPTAQPVAIGELRIGTYASQQFQPPMRFAVLDAGWIANRDSSEQLGLIRDTEPTGSLQFVRVSGVRENPCVAGSSELATVGRDRRGCTL